MPAFAAINKGDWRERRTLLLPLLLAMIAAAGPVAAVVVAVAAREAALLQRLADMRHNMRSMVRDDDDAISFCCGPGQGEGSLSFALFLLVSARGVLRRQARGCFASMRDRLLRPPEPLYRRQGDEPPTQRSDGGFEGKKKTKQPPSDGVVPEAPVGFLGRRLSWTSARKKKRSS
jgi:hypothetical protein